VSVDGISRSDVLVVGSGTAGLTAALGCAPLRVTVLTKTTLVSGSSPWAQGGVAAAVGAGDTPALHAADTLSAGAGLNDAGAVAVLTGEGPERVRALLEMGARFDRDAAGDLALGLEAAHGRARILHAKDATGAEIVRTLIESVKKAPDIRTVERAFAVDLLVEDGRAAGVVAIHEDGRRVAHLAPAVVLATGGVGQLYLHTTNPREATGDGLAMAARAGVRLVDLEFVQFHPTALDVETEGAPMPLLTEALRGEGAVLLDETGHRFMTDEHPAAELAPRDIVARAIWRRLRDGHRVFLDAREAVGERFPDRFPTVFSLCREHGLDPRIEPIPVAPAAHYHMGGIDVDDHGRTSLPGLWACGEVASTGVHGANRLASNSLLEALVFGARVAEDLRNGLPARRQPAFRVIPRPAEGSTMDDAALSSAVRRILWEKVGVVRDEQGLTSAIEDLTWLAKEHPRASGEARNLLAVGRLVAAAALARRESRGGHYRSDYPMPDPDWQRRLRLTAAPDGSALFEDAAHEPAAAETPRAAARMGAR
jgi:L-aspartate oxidase